MAKRLINFKVVLHVIGSLIIINGILMSLAIPFSIYYDDSMLLPFITSCATILLVGFFLRIYTRENKNDEIKKREGFLIVAMGWLSMALFGCLPYIISGWIPNISNAFFETMSGFTTTGATILGGDSTHKISSLPESLLFWRSMTQWIGGMGIIVLTIAILPMLGIGGMELFVAEAPGPTKDKIHPRIKETAKRLWVIYMGLTVLQTIILMICGLDFYQAINHALTTNSTGGFSPQDTSIGAFNNPAVEYVIVVFMFLAGTNFTLLYFALKRKVFQIRENDEFKWYLMAVVGLTILLSFLIYDQGDSIEATIRTSLFQVVSIITTTGYATADYMNWIPLVQMIFFVLLFSGASAGSTSGGIKIVRIVLLIKNGLVEFKRRLHPKAIIPVHLNKKPVSDQIIYNLLAFIFLYLFIFTIGAILITAMGVDFVEAISAVATSLGNVGPGLGQFGPAGSFSELPEAGKWILSLFMLMGRLELFTVVLVMTPYFWRRI